LNPTAVPPVKHLLHGSYFIRPMDHLHREPDEISEPSIRNLPWLPPRRGSQGKKTSRKSSIFSNRMRPAAAHSLHWQFARLQAEKRKLPGTRPGNFRNLNFFRPLRWPEFCEALYITYGNSFGFIYDLKGGTPFR
jgi:hypothetical protein